MTSDNEMFMLDRLHSVFFLTLFFKYILKLFLIFGTAASFMKVEILLQSWKSVRKNSTQRPRLCASVL